MGLSTKEKRELEINIGRYIDRQRAEGLKVNIDEIEEKNIGYTSLTIRNILDRLVRRNVLLPLDKYNWEVLE